MGIKIYPTVPWQSRRRSRGQSTSTRSASTRCSRASSTPNFRPVCAACCTTPRPGSAAQSGEAALEAIAGALPALNELKERTLSQAMGPRQRSILEPLIETRLDWAAGTLGRLAERATIEVDDASVADRIAGLKQDAATSWHDPAYLQKLGRTTVEELRYQGERRGWDPAETDARVRGGLSDLYAGAVETAIGQTISTAPRPSTSTPARSSIPSARPPSIAASSGPARPSSTATSTATWPASRSSRRGRPAPRSSRTCRRTHARRRDRRDARPHRPGRRACPSPRRAAVEPATGRGRRRRLRLGREEPRPVVPGDPAGNPRLAGAGPMARPRSSRSSTAASGPTATSSSGSIGR